MFHSCEIVRGSSVLPPGGHYARYDKDRYGAWDRLFLHREMLWCIWWLTNKHCSLSFPASQVMPDKNVGKCSLPQPIVLITPTVFFQAQGFPFCEITHNFQSVFYRISEEVVRFKSKTVCFISNAEVLSNRMLVNIHWCFCDEHPRSGVLSLCLCCSWEPMVRFRKESC